MCSLFLGAALEGVIAKYFGNDIMDELFNRYTKKVAQSSLNPEADKLIVLFVLLKNNNQTLALFQRKKIFLLANKCNNEKENILVINYPLIRTSLIV